MVLRGYLENIDTKLFNFHHLFINILKNKSFWNSGANIEILLVNILFHWMYIITVTINHAPRVDNNNIMTIIPIKAIKMLRNQKENKNRVLLQ